MQFLSHVLQSHSISSSINTEYVYALPKELCLSQSTLAEITGSCSQFSVVRSTQKKCHVAGLHG